MRFDRRFPELYQHVLETVKACKDEQGRPNGHDVNNREFYRLNWWIFGEPRRELRPALENLPRYIATVETAKHRIFQFLDASILPDNMLVCMGLDDAFFLGVLSSRLHVVWALRAGGWLGIGNDPRYSKSRVFDPFPFPDASETLKARIRQTAEELDALRKNVQGEHPLLTLTQMYNVLEKLRAGATLDAEDEAVKTNGLILILRELHDKLDSLVAEAYGWPATLSDDGILAKLVALNAERAAEEKRGVVHWLRPDYQRARAGVAPEPSQAPIEEQLEALLIVEAEKVQKPTLPDKRPGAHRNCLRGAYASQPTAGRQRARQELPARCQGRARDFSRPRLPRPSGSRPHQRRQNLRLAPRRLNDIMWNVTSSAR